MNPEPAKTSESVTADLGTHKRLPEKTKDLLRLQDDAQKASGLEEVALNKKIADKSH